MDEAIKVHGREIIAVAAAALCRKHGVSSATFYKWKVKFGGLDVSEARRLKRWKTRNAKLQRVLADAMLDNVALKGLLGKMVTPTAHREAAAYLQQTYEMSQRRACRACAAKRLDDAALREPLKALAQERRRFGYRRLHVLLRREDHAVNKKRVQRLYVRSG